MQCQQHQEPDPAKQIVERFSVFEGKTCFPLLFFEVCHPRCVV